MDTFKQTLIPTERKILLRNYSCDNATDAINNLIRLDPDVVGIDINLSVNNFVDHLVLATSTTIFCISLGGKARPAKSASHNLDTLLRGSQLPLVGFEAAKVALYLYKDWNCHFRGVDLSTLFSRSTLRPSRPMELVGKVLTNAHSEAVSSIWNSAYHRAWLAARIGEQCLGQVEAALKVDTTILRKEELILLATLVRQANLLENAKAKVVDNDFSHVVDGSKGWVIHNTRYKSRVRQSGQTAVIMTTNDGKEIVGQATNVTGKQTTVQIQSSECCDNIRAIRVVGQEELTLPELARNEFVLLVLRGERQLDSSNFTRYLWFSSTIKLPQRLYLPSKRLDNIPSSIAKRLNTSQLEVVTAMLSSTSPLILAHGPPGTGKTTTISTAVKIRAERGERIWIAAQSNVAVKNLAESLCKHEVDFRLFVSKEFYVEWHEHIYNKIERKLIRSDELRSDLCEMGWILGEATILLCTLSMLSNPVLEDQLVFTLRPVTNLVIDEASQISAFEYMHLFDKFDKLETVSFFGDPKQLPPYGQDTVATMKSIFELKHLQPQSFFLNVQYRMPVPLGDFISDQVYESKLQSQHDIRDLRCVSFVDVDKGLEEASGKSWKNEAEVQTIVHLVQHYYRTKDFCIITPYDAQRAAIENQLKHANLPWERVFNVDSFQGNEAPFVLVSVVRTTKPGFLAFDNRVNVMLTRCKAGMVIVTNRMFIRNEAQATLVGKLARHWENTLGEVKTWTNWRLVAEARASLPGAAGTRPSGILIPKENSSPTQLTWSPQASPMYPAPSATGVRPRKLIPLCEEAAIPAVKSNISYGPQTAVSLQRIMKSLNVRQAGPDPFPSHLTHSAEHHAATARTSVTSEKSSNSDFPALEGVRSRLNTVNLQGQWAKNSDVVKLPYQVVDIKKRSRRSKRIPAS